MRLILKSSVVLGLVCCTTARADQQIFSGPQPGEKITSFEVLQVTGPKAAKEVKIIDTKKGGPTFLVFVHKVTEPAIGLMMQLEWYAKKLDGLASHYVFLTDDQAKTEQQVRRWWDRLFSGSPLNISLDGAEGPGRYGLHRKVPMTVLVAKDNKVVANFALLAPNANDAPEILAEVAKVMGKPAPSIEKIRKELRAERTRRREMRLKQNPVYKLAPNAELGRLMLRMLYREGNTAAYAKEAADEMTKWAGDDGKKKAALVKYCKAVLDGKFEFNEHGSKALKKLAGR